ncbi:EVE domain-containing protein [Brunnivagina elsteri]
MKSEPDVYGITNLEQQGKTVWDGVRNYQARNFMRQMQPEDLVFFYHSNTKTPGIVGLMRVVKTDIIDPTQFDLKSEYYDPKSTLNSPRWQTVLVEFVEAFANCISISVLRGKFDADELILLRKGNRLSVMPIVEDVAVKILAMKGNSLNIEPLSIE